MLPTTYTPSALSAWPRQLWARPRHRFILLAIFAAAFALILLRTATVPLHDNKARSSIRGDQYSDVNTYSAARYFRDHGVAHTYGLPVHKYSPTHPADSAIVYTHYPALPDWVAGAVFALTGTDHVAWLRLVPILLSVFLCGYVFTQLSYWLPHPAMALWGGALVVLSHYFLFFADSFHKHVYEELFKWLFVFGLLAYYRDRKLGQLLLCALWYALAAHSSFEPVVYLAVVALGFSWVYTGSPLRWPVFVLGASAALSVALHFYTVYLYWGSWQGLMNDLTQSALHRIQGTGPLAEAGNQALGLGQYLQIPFQWFNRPERLFMLPGWGLLLLLLLAGRGLRQVALPAPAGIRLWRIGLVLLLATLSWSLVMPQHFLVHLFVTRHWGIFYGLIGGYCLHAYAQGLCRSWASLRLPARLLHSLLIVYVLAMAISQQLLDWFRHGFLYPFLHH